MKETARKPTANSGKKISSSHDFSATKIGFVSLGCAKALVDSERILTQLRAEGYEFTQAYGDADLVVVNTCGFLDSARDESLAAIGEALKENGKVVVTGCLGATPDLIRARYPEVLSITGPAQYESVVAAVHQAFPPLHDPYLDLLPPAGIKLTPRHYAYLKISEGCNNSCSFCIIPKLRGKLRSRPLAEVMDEAQKLADSGVKELLVVSQDTSAYGVDIRYKDDTKLYNLAKSLGQLGIWIRLHYVYPYPNVDSVVELMADGAILPYLDIPFQHASPDILKAMKRPANQEKTLERIAAWRKICPDITLRSTFIVGFPGETDKDFRFLLDWLKEAQLDRVGCFKYENVSGADARDLAAHVDEDLKQERWNEFMATQQEISRQRLRRHVGKKMQALVDSVSPQGIIARTIADAPEIDGVVHVKAQGRVLSGSFINVTIDDSDDYDLFATQI